MSTNTTHYNLKKPQQADKIADTITELGTNMDTIDTQMYTNATKIASASELGNIKVGQNLTIDVDGTLNATGGSGSSTWGSITGTLSDQTDLNTALSGKLGTSGDGQSVTVTFTESATRDAITTGSTLATLFGKIKKWLTDLASVAFSGSYSDLSNKPTSLNSINASEYSTLNNAIQEPASEGTNGQVLTTNGAGGRSWTTVQGGGGGTSDHSQLTNLAYANSGHTGFAGTSVTNTFTTVQTIEADSYDGLMLADEDDNTKYTALGKNGYHYQNGDISRYVTYSDIIRSDANTNTAIYNVWYGTEAQYEALTTKDANTLYFIPEE